MRKIIILTVIFSVFVCAGLSEVYAEDGILTSLPNIKQGVGYSLADNEGDNEILSLTTVDVVQWKKLSIGAGIATELDNDDAINPALTANYHIGGLEQWGFTYPLAKIVNIDVGLFASRDMDEENMNWGIQASIIKIKL